MIKEYSGRVMQAVGGRLKVDIEGKVFNCLGRGALHREMTIIPGDKVKLSYTQNRYIVEKIDKRTNSLVRPPIANIDNVLIVISSMPKPDLMLVDKLIANCKKEKINVVLCHNKMDITDIETDEQVAEYQGILPIIKVSAVTGENIEDLRAILINKLTCFAGQSAVGKSTIINAIAGTDLQVIGELSKIDRGKNTTRYIKIIDIGQGMLLADTCGFSSLESMSIPPQELTYYYSEYMQKSRDCKYKGCVHINEPECAVKEAVANGELSQKRYDRYKQIYNETSDKWSRRYE